MSAWMAFLAALTPVLWDIYEHFASGKPTDPETEKRLAMALVRAAKDAQARAELGG